MKKAISLFILTLTFLSIQAVSKVDVYYFHYTRRCVTCQAVETETLKSIQQLYSKHFKTGEVSFKSVNLDEKTNEAIAKKCKAEGQALLVISNNKRVELTEQGFMYAINSPEKLKAELKKVIDSLL
ncbi:MAG: nitrophenyl compound nitroreductase subunit ArsF family protein [Paludibacter sp.]|jgi:hypothetical protein